MQRTIIALWGVGGIGKTTTIRQHVYDVLATQYECLDRGHQCITEVKAAILEIDGVKVGFNSAGDTPRIVEKLLKELIDAGCDIIVCATHTSRSETSKIVQHLAEDSDPPYTPVWIEKGGRNANQVDADSIIAEIHKAIGRRVCDVVS